MKCETEQSRLCMVVIPQCNARSMLDMLEPAFDTLKVVPLVSVTSPSPSSAESTPLSPRSTCSGSSQNNSPQFRKMNCFARFSHVSHIKSEIMNSGKIE